MRIGTTRVGRIAAVLLVLALIAAACGDDADDTTTTAATAAGTETTAASTETTAATAAGEPIKVGELAYYTGEFAPYGPSLSADVIFPVEEVINLDPPLGRMFELYHEDIGTVGEGQAARTLVEQHDIDVLVSAAHEYRTYRDWLQEVIAETDSPLMPTVHGGTIPQNLGGVGTEPIFRAQGLDEALGMSGVQYAGTIGAETVVIFATQVEGFQLAADAAEKAALALDIEVLDRLDVQAEQSTYRTEAQRIAELEPDAVIVQAGSVESATLIKQAAEAGLSLHWIGETGWIQPEFIGTLGSDAIATQESIGFAAFSANQDSPAWEFYSDLWNNNPDYAQYGDANDQYHFSTYDLMIITALAIEEAGSADASAWAPAMFMVTDPPGTVCYTYADCLALIRAGEEIDYEGVTGPGTFTSGGVNAVTQTYTPFKEDGTVGVAVVLDPDEGLAIIEVIAVEAECDPNNVCTW
jgi:ABC-type branched-subunit amino acid transport system substrate-binding protein